MKIGSRMLFARKMHARTQAELIHQRFRRWPCLPVSHEYKVCMWLLCVEDRKCSYQPSVVFYRIEARNATNDHCVIRRIPSRTKSPSFLIARCPECTGLNKVGDRPYFSLRGGGLGDDLRGD